MCLRPFTTIRRTLRGWMCGVDPDHVLIVGGPGACGWVPRRTLRGWMCGVDPDHVLIVGGPDGAGCLHTVPRHLVSVCTFQPPSVGGQEFDVDAEIRERCLGARASCA
ncbi:hypothetical protein TGRUB_360340 [Toxoplasma gondii RUB]|uniref:Uncharacterized protein n=2 Tax=Toxoplasma gondii TaxID=5811 RepID=A0A086LJ37_TOXGO|nr:hypothetical protein TGRUB_360340 [Toxoplasma gondii RUB]KFG99333.1 hypothetical protein TGVAND_360340 [Toxoplasma gondii VAND]